MALYRCAACGSANVVTDKQSEGVSYNYKKGIVGAAVFGAGGAIAGIENKSVQVFKCSDCGVTLTYSMPDDMKSIIDFCLLSASARDNINYHGVPMTWSFIKQKYKNIETTEIDRMIEEKKSITGKNCLSITERFDSESFLTRSWKTMVNNFDLFLI